MKSLTITLSAPMYKELCHAANAVETWPANFAIEAIESVLASRRLPKITAGAGRPRLQGECAIDPRPYVAEQQTFRDGVEP